MREQVLFVLEVVVEHAVGDLGLAGDVTHAEPGAASLVDQPGGSGDEVLAQVLAIPTTQDGRFPR